PCSPASGWRRGDAGGHRASRRGRRCGTAPDADWRSLGLRSYHWRMNGRQILVTGAGGGIGGATADELARLGAHVFCADVDEGRATATARRTRGTAVVLDVSDLAAAERAVRSAAPTLHGIVHAAGISPR